MRLTQEITSVNHHLRLQMAVIEMRMSCLMKLDPNLSPDEIFNLDQRCYAAKVIAEARGFLTARGLLFCGPSKSLEDWRWQEIEDVFLIIRYFLHEVRKPMIL